MFVDLAIVVSTPETDRATAAVIPPAGLSGHDIFLNVYQAGLVVQCVSRSPVHQVQFGKLIGWSQSCAAESVGGRFRPLGRIANGVDNGRACWIVFLIHRLGNLFHILYL